jgi:hypothetical protein
MPLPLCARTTTRPLAGAFCWVAMAWSADMPRAKVPDGR